MGKPEIREMDTMYQSFRPGLKQSKRYEMQDQGNFYKTQFPSSAYSSRINSYAARLASAETGNRQAKNESRNGSKVASMQATCKDMKAEMTKANSMFGYDIKQKHMNTMTGFFTAKNFELISRMDTPSIDGGKKDK